VEDIVNLELESWERQFRRSAHPLAKAVGRFVRFEDLLAASEAVSYLYSNSTLTLIRESLGVSETKSLDGQPIVELIDVAAALITRVRRGTADALPHEIERVLQRHLSSAAPTKALERREARYDAARQPTAAGWLLGPQLTTALGLAAHMAAYATGGGIPRVSLWQFIVAALALPRGRAVFSGGLLDNTSLPADELVRGIVSDLMDEVKRMRRDEGEMQRWISLLEQVGAMPLPAEKEARPPSRPEYARDKPIEDRIYDTLDFRSDVAAVAELICLRSPGPPLAVGLFGDWGSGKSSFMRLLESEIELLTAQARSQQEDNTFIKRAVHIRFNAWHYNDTGLWPALADELFNQLRTGGAAGRGEGLLEGLIEDLTGKVAQWTSEADQAAETLITQHTDARAIETELAKLEEQREQALESARETAAEALSAAASRVPSADALFAIYQEAIGRSRMTEATSLPEAPSDAAVGADQVVQILHDSTALRVVADAFRSLSRQANLSTLILFWLPLVVLLVVFLGARTDTLASLIPVVTAGRAELLALIAPLGPLAWLVRTVAPFLSAAKRYRSDQRKVIERYGAQASQQRARLRQVRRQMLDSERELQKKVTRAARFRGQSPQQILDFFLEEGAAVKAIKGDLGVISRVRHAFDQLNQVLGEKPAAEPQREFPEAVVLYIDDLDRCRSEQVVRVLEAVHLLLAFERFVVIVGVDTRWLETSLLSYFEHQLRSGDDSQDESLRPRATARDYLEKIFQVPIQLRRLTFGEDGSYTRLVDTLAGLIQREEGVEEGAQPQAKTPAKAYGRIQPIAAVPVKVTEPARFADAVERARLREREVRLLEQLGPIAGRSPRAVKRFLNLYRLLRATRSGPVFDRFIGERRTADGTGDASWPEFPASQFWLAVEVGQPSDQIQRLRQAILAAAEDTRCGTLAQVFAVPRAPAPGETSGTAGPTETAAPPQVQPCRSTFQAFWENLPPQIDSSEVANALVAIERALPPDRSGISMLRDALIECARYSFVPLGPHG